MRILTASVTFLMALGTGACVNTTSGPLSWGGKISKSQTFLPLSDQNNSGGWVLNTDVSDEFNAANLDEDKWYVAGKFENGVPVYKHPDDPDKKVWIGRAPSQFSGRNYRLEDGMLILETRWEPDFPFSDKLDKPWGPDGTRSRYENVTTASILGRDTFKYGYMEIRSKAADAEITSSFWSIGKGLEIDMFEQFGDHRQPEKFDKDRELWWSIHDWTQKPKGPSVYTERHDLGFRVADDFHTYGFEWDETGIKYYVDGKLFTEANAEKINAYHREKGYKGGYNKGWVANKPISIWLDQETFPWHGIPDSKEDLELNSPPGKKDDGVVDFEIDYVRVWQRGGK